MKLRSRIDVDKDIHEDVKLFCFLRQRPIQPFVTEALRDALEPYQQWLNSFRRLQEEEKCKMKDSS